MDKVKFLQKELNKVTERVKFLEEENERFKWVSAFFLGNFLNDVDNVMPDDLEYALAHYEKQIEEMTHTYNGMCGTDTNAGWIRILKLCKELGMRHTNGLTETQDIKIFIKELSRKNFDLGKENENLLKLLKATITNI